MANCESDAMLETLLRYKAMALDQSKHEFMLKDKTVLQFLAYSLDSDDSEAIEASLKTVELLIHNNKNHETLRTTFGVYEALKATSTRDYLEESLRSLAKELYHKLEEPPCVNFEIPKNISSETVALNKKKLSSKVHSFHIFGLNEDTRSSIESAIIRTRGVISVIIDTGHQRCVVRALENVTPQTLVECIARETKLEARLVLRNKLRQEVLVDLGKDENSNADDITDEGDLPQYLPEEESPVKEKAVHTFGRLRTSAASWVRSATALFQNSFYW